MGNPVGVVLGIYGIYARVVASMATVRGVASKAFRIPTTETIHRETGSLFLNRFPRLMAGSNEAFMVASIKSIIGKNR